MRVGRNPLKKRRTNPHSASTYEALKFVLFLQVEYVQFGIELRFVGKGMLCLEKFPAHYTNSNDETNDKEHNHIFEERSTEEEAFQRPEDNGNNCDRKYARFRNKPERKVESDD
jgi:hypothetical protein